MTELQLIDRLQRVRAVLREGVERMTPQECLADAMVEDIIEELYL